MLSGKCAAGEYFCIGTLRMSFTSEWEAYIWSRKKESQFGFMSNAYCVRFCH